MPSFLPIKTVPQLQLRESEQIYRGAVITGRLASWETNMVTGERIWTQEGLAMFGLDLPNGRGIVGGENDEFRRTLHPDDRHKVAEFHRTADEIDSYPAEYRIVRADGSLSWNELRRFLIDELRNADAPLSARDLAEKIIGLEGKVARDRALRNDMAKRVGKSLKLLRQQGSERGAV